MLHGIIFTLQIVSCIFLILLVLLQKGEGAEIGATFGGASQTVFGPRGPATFINKLTVAVAIVFFGTSLALAGMAKHTSSRSVIEKAGTSETYPIKSQAGATSADQGASSAPSGNLPNAGESAKSADTGKDAGSQTDTTGTGSNGN